MKLHSKENECAEAEVGVVLPDIHSEIPLKGKEMLKLRLEQPGLVIRCTSGALWLTQPGDPHDHILKAGQAFQLYRQGTILVQGLPHCDVLVQAGV